MVDVGKMVRALNHATGVSGLRRHSFYYSGHGGWFPADRTFTVPSGRRIYFYVRHGHSLGDARGGNIESTVGKFGGGAKKYLSSGELCYNYCLFPPDGLDIMNHKINPFCKMSKNPQGTLLSNLLEDPATIGADIHWVACRNIM